MTVRKFRVLFLCTGNACRSQMAEGWAKHLWPDRLEASSAGVLPSGLSADAVRVSFYVLALGVVIGLIGSTIGLRRFLKV